MSSWLTAVFLIGSHITVVLSHKEEIILSAILCTMAKVCVTSSCSYLLLCRSKCKLCVKSHSHEFFDCLDHEFLNWENLIKLSTDHSGKYAPS